MSGGELFFLGSVAVRWQDLLDVLIVAYLIFRLLMLIRGTIAVQMVIAILFLFSLLKISSSNPLELHTLHWLLQHFWSVALVAVIIIFQPELRRALMQLGIQPILSRRRQRDVRVIEEIVRACGAFASSRTGALIVLERETGLQQIREIGMPVDSVVTNEMIRTIFFPHSPMHDGAAIIKECKIVAAACFLPLTKNPNVPKHYGTRHRAALGLSEESDAVIIVVSEETGTISLALNGQMHSMSGVSELRDQLMSIYGLQE